MPDIYHITGRGEWDSAVAAGRYSPASLENEGFIHCSGRWQVLDIANARFQGVNGLVLLCIDTGRVVPEIRNEDCYDCGQRFPHIYGPLDTAAITAVIDFPPKEDGTFDLPDGIG